MIDPMSFVAVFWLILIACYLVLLGNRIRVLDQKVSRLLEHHGLIPPLSERIKEAAADPARKIEAIKLYREETGAGLAEAKEAVEAYQRTLGQ